VCEDSEGDFHSLTAPSIHIIYVHPQGLPKKGEEAGPGAWIAPDGERGFVGTNYASKAPS